VSRARDGTDPGRAQPERESRAKIEKSPGKLAKAKRLSFAFICFLESGLFNALPPIQMEFFSPIFNSRPSCKPTPRTLFLAIDQNPFEPSVEKPA
jgi:hypothetical protein